MTTTKWLRLLILVAAVAGGMLLTQPVWTQGAALLFDAYGSARMVIRDAAGNARGANVDASNRLTVLADINNGSATSTVGGTASVALVSFVGVDPCMSNAKVLLAISQATSTQLFAGTSAKKTYVCGLSIVATTAENVSLISGTGTVCATNAAAMIGGTTGVLGMAFAANGGINMGGANASVAVSAANADNVCLVQTGSVRIGGVMSYVVQ